jgi:hypothetical protein
VRSQRTVKQWVKENVAEAGNAMWHAAALVSQGADVLDGDVGGHEVGGGRLWHHAWAMYLGTLVIWGVWYARPVTHVPVAESLPPSAVYEDEEEDDIIWDPRAEMDALLEKIAASEPQRLLEAGCVDGIAVGLGKRGTNGLAAVVSRCLSKVRWAVVHDGMMVLKGLVQWRLIGGGGNFA